MNAIDKVLPRNIWDSLLAMKADFLLLCKNLSVSSHNQQISHS